MYKPENINSFSRPQIILSSDRIILNSKSDSIFLFSDKSIGLSTNGSIHLNSREKTIINSPQIQLGLNSNEPLILGNKHEEFTKTLLVGLKELSSTLSKLSSLPEGTPHVEINKSANDLVNVINNLINQLPDLKSKNNFTL